MSSAFPAAVCFTSLWMQVFGCLPLQHHCRRWRSELPRERELRVPLSLPPVSVHRRLETDVAYIVCSSTDPPSRRGRRIRDILSSCMVRLFSASLLFSIALADSQSRRSPPFSGDGRSPCGPTRQRHRRCGTPNLGADPSVASAHDPNLQTFSSVMVPTMAPVGELSGNHPRGSGICIRRTEPRAVVATAAPNAVTNTREPGDISLRQSDPARQRHASEVAQCSRSQDSRAVAHTRLGS